MNSAGLSRRSFVGGLLAGAMLPGRYQARIDIGRPLGERLFFAGEATAAPYYTLCAGAYDSGLRAAGEAIAALG